MHIELQNITIGKKELLRNLFELYTYDFSDYMDVDVDDHGRLAEGYINRYFHSSAYHSYLIVCAGKIAGFVIVKAEAPHLYTIDQFFIMKKYRRTGLGKTVACRIFDKHQGQWRIAQMAANLPAQAFWRKVISSYTKGNYQETYQQDKTWKGPVQTFSNQQAMRKKMVFRGRGEYDDSMLLQCIQGVKTAACTPKVWYDQLPAEERTAIGDIVYVYNQRGQHRCTVEITENYEIRFGQVDERIAKAEACDSVQEFWIDYIFSWKGALQRDGYELNDDTAIVVKHFKVLSVMDQHSSERAGS